MIQACKCNKDKTKNQPKKIGRNVYFYPNTDVFRKS